MEMTRVDEVSLSLLGLSSMVRIVIFARPIASLLGIRQACIRNLRIEEWQVAQKSWMRGFESRAVVLMRHCVDPSFGLSLWFVTSVDNAFAF